MSARKLNGLKRSQSVPLIAAKEVPGLKRYRTVSPTQKVESATPSTSDGEELDDPYAGSGSQDSTLSQDSSFSQDSEASETATEKSTKKKKQRPVFSPMDSFQGQNRETMDELNYLLDGIKDTHPLVRHSSLLTLVNLLADTHAFRLLCLNGSFQPIFAAMLCNLRDPLFQAALLASAYLATGEKSNLRFLGEEGARFLLLLATGGQLATNTVSEEVATPSKLVKGRPVSRRHRNSSSGGGGSGVGGKTVQETEFFKVVNTRQWGEFTTQPVSQKLLALWTLVKGADDVSFRSILVQIDFAKQFLPLIDADALLLMDGDSSVKERLNYHLGIFEQLANGEAHAQLLGAHEGKTPNNSLISITMNLLHRCNQQNEKEHDAYVSSVLLLLVNLTNKSDVGCRAVCGAKHEEGANLIQVLVDLVANAKMHYEQGAAGLYDTITTTLGVLINLVEVNADSRQLLVDTAVRESPGVAFFVDWFVASDRAYQSSVKKSKASPIKHSKKIPRSASCLSPSKYSTPTKAPVELYPSSPTSPSSSSSSSSSFASSSSSSGHPPSFKRSSGSLAAVSDDELEAESGVLENQMISCYLAVLLGFLLANLSEPRRFEVQCHFPNKEVGGVVGKLKEFLVIQSDASMLTDDTLETIMNLIDHLGKHTK